MDTDIAGINNYQDCDLPDFNQLKVNNRIDVYDKAKAKWREARVLEIIFEDQQPASIKSIKVHFKGLHSKFDEIIMAEELPKMVSPIQWHLSKKKQTKKGSSN